MFTLAHLSDPHLGDMGPIEPTALLNKRCLGLFSWTVRRRPVHVGPVLPALVEDLKHERPSHIAVTGDITNISLPVEFERAAAWLRSLGDPEAVTVIPGNHDAYVPIAWERSLGLWGANMAGEDVGLDGVERPVAGLDGFPFVRRRGPLALVGVSTAEPMPLHMAAGRVGAAQLTTLEQILTASGAHGLFRVVLIHHPPLAGAAGRRKRLLDDDAFRAVVARAGAELVIFGHTHVSALGKLDTPVGTIPAIGVPSASARPHRGKDHSRYHLYRVAGGPGGWRLSVEVRGVAPSLDRFRREGGFEIAVPGARRLAA
jgi:3',5'-cyclic AMP phosphodiesterase CpdA